MTQEKNISWGKTGEEDVVRNRWIALKRASYDLPTGAHVEDYYLVEKPDVVIIVVLNENDETYLIQEWERGVEEIGYKFPAGRVDEDEDPAQAANREALEEIGAKGQLVPIGTGSIEPGLMTSRAHYFMLRVDSSVIDESLREASEPFIGEWMPLTEVNKMIDENEIQNPFVVVATRKVDAHFRKNK